MEQKETKQNNWYNKTWLVLLLCFVFFPIGLFALWINSSISKVWKIVITILVILFLAIVFSDNTKTSTTSKKENIAIDNKTEKEHQIVFDVPSLLNKNIDEIRKDLGQPIDKEMLEPTKVQMDMNFEEWDNNFEKNGYSLLVTFNPQTRKVIDFFLSTTTSEKIDNIDKILMIGNLESNSSDYKLKTIIALKSKEITGIKITPN
jgi:hypothetical protein